MNRPKSNSAALQRLLLAFTTGLLLALGARVSYTAETPAAIIGR